MCVEKSNLPEISAHFVNNSEKSITCVNTVEVFPSQEDQSRWIQKHAQHVLHDSIFKGDVFDSKEQRQYATRKYNERKEMWSIDDYEHFWTQIDDIHQVILAVHSLLMSA